MGACASHQKEDSKTGNEIAKLKAVADATNLPNPGPMVSQMGHRVSDIKNTALEYGNRVSTSYSNPVQWMQPGATYPVDAIQTMARSSLGTSMVPGRTKVWDSVIGEFVHVLDYNESTDGLESIIQYGVNQAL